MFKAAGFKRSLGSSKPLVISGSLGEHQHIIPEYTPISSQGVIGSCSSNSCSDALEILKGLEDKNKVIQVSRLFSYWNGRLYDQSTNKDEGAFISGVLSSFKDIGVCSEETYPYDPAKVFLQPPIECYKEASDNTIQDFYQIMTTGPARLNDIELAIRANHPVIFGTLVSPEFQAYSGAAKVFSPPIGGAGHAMLIVGIRYVNGKREFYIRNSWGLDFGIQGEMIEVSDGSLQDCAGHCWMSEEYMTWEETSDLFVPTRMIDFL